MVQHYRNRSGRLTEVPPGTYQIREVLQNPEEPCDVSGNGIVSPLDLLLLINELNVPKYSDPETKVLQVPPPANTPPPFLDVDNDGFMTATDLLIVLNKLNAGAGNGAAQGEDEAPNGAGGSSVQLQIVDVISHHAPNTPLRGSSLSRPSFDDDAPHIDVQGDAANASTEPGFTLRRAATDATSNRGGSPVKRTSDDNWLLRLQLDQVEDTLGTIADDIAAQFALPAR